MKDKLTWEKSGDAVIFRFHGEITSDISADLKQAIISVLHDEHSEIAVFDLKDATYIDSMGIGMFVHLHVQHHSRIRFLFCSLSEPVSRAFGYVKLISFFDIHEDCSAALEGLDR